MMAHTRPLGPRGYSWDRVSDIEHRFVCTACGGRGIDIRPFSAGKKSLGY
jgi:hypothetical protein